MIRYSIAIAAAGLLFRLIGILSRAFLRPSTQVVDEMASCKFMHVPVPHSCLPKTNQAVVMKSVRRWINDRMSARDR